MLEICHFGDTQKNVPVRLNVSNTFRCEALMIGALKCETGIYIEFYIYI